MSTFYRINSYLSHWLDAVDKHSIHSPFFFDFYNKVVGGNTDPAQFSSIETTRSKLLANQTLITIHDLGSGSSVVKGNKRTLSSIAKHSLAPAEYAQLYFRICQYIGAKRIVELGTSLGITSLYLSENKKAQVYTFEGSESIAQVALTNFESFETKNIHLIEGNIDESLPDFLQNPAKIDFLLMDANHRYEPTLRYFDWLMRRLSEKSIVVVDDIHHSPEMEKAWHELKQHDLVYGSADLYRCGILFFDPDLNKQHFVWSI